MKLRLLAGALIAFGAPIIASAQCVAPITPATALVGQTYAFSVNGTRVAAIGTFTAFANGYLAITETVVDTSGSTTNVINRRAPTSGRWMSNDTCNGGMIWFMLNRESFVFTYTTGVVAGQPVLNLVGRDDSYKGALAPVQGYVVTGCVGPGGVTVGTPPRPAPSCNAITGPAPWGPPPDVAALIGTAWLNPPTACPPGLGNPLNLIKGIPISIVYAGFAAILTPSFPNPAAHSGDLVLNFLPVPFTRTSVDPPVNYPLYGRYIIYPDCSGGEFLIMGLRPPYTQLDFVFTDGTFTKFVSIADGAF